MKHGPIVFLAAFFALSLSWGVFVLVPQFQLGREQQVVALVTAETYPQSRPGLAREGAQLYRANGCAYCHSQQVRQTGIECSLVLDDMGTNPMAVAEAVMNANIGIAKASPPALAAGLPKPIKTGLTAEIAQAAAKKLKDAGAKAEVDIVTLGPDIAWGWGPRRTVAQDFLADDTVQVGSMRVGPDLANIGLRKTDANWHLVHLYAPSIAVRGSPMPSYRFLFEERKKGSRPSPDALQFEPGSGPPGRIEVIPKPAAKALVAYLLSLRANAPLLEGPMSPPPAPAPAAATNAPTK